MGDLDIKDIGLAIKDIVLGAGTVAAGVTGGPAAAGGVKQAGGALDRILGMAGVEPTRAQPMAGVEPTRAQQFDRADFTARPQTQGPAGGSDAKPPGVSSPMAKRAQLGDARIAVDHLRGLGWPDGTVQRILSGPDQARAREPHPPPAVVTAQSVPATAPSEPDTAAHPVHGALQEAGWPADARRAILAGPYAFAEYMKPAQHVPDDAFVARLAQHSPDAILQANLHHSTERGGHSPELYHGTHEAQVAGLGETTEHPEWKET